MPSGDREEVEGLPEGGLSRSKHFHWNAATGAWERAPGTLAGGAIVQGAAANDAAAVGNPVQVGGVANNDPPTAVGGGDALPLRLDTVGRLIVQREGIETASLASAARTASGQSATQSNRGWSHILAMLDITAVSGTTPTLDLRMDAGVGTTYRRLAGSGGTAVSFLQATVAGDDDHLHAGPSVVAKETGTDRHFNIVLPRVWRWDFTIGGTSPSFTFSVTEDYSG